MSKKTNQSQSEAIETEDPQYPQDSESLNLFMSPTQSDSVMETEGTPSHWPSPDLAKDQLLTWVEEDNTSNFNPTPSITHSSPSTDDEFHTPKKHEREPNESW